MRLPRSFYARDPRVVAEALVGTYLVHGDRGGRIVETEAYLGPRDKASHARFGPEGRSKVMYGPAGVAYVFLIYGMHDCFNIVTGKEGEATAVLVRALEPLPGTGPCNGPGRLSRSLGIDRRQNMQTLLAGSLYVEDRGEPRPRIVTTARIGVDYAGAWARRKLRYIDADSPHLSVRLPRR